MSASSNNAIALRTPQQASHSATSVQRHRANRPTPRTSLTNEKAKASQAARVPMGAASTAEMPRVQARPVTRTATVPLRTVPGSREATGQAQADSRRAQGRPSRRRTHTSEASEDTPEPLPLASRHDRARSARAVTATAKAKAKAARGESRSVSPHLVRFLMVVGVLLVAGAMLYSPARSYYVARRTNQDLNAQLVTVNANNEQLSDDVSSLETREGIEDEARRRGYVSSGETAVTMDGAEDTGTDTSAAVTSDDLATASSRDLPWYVSALDVLFQYQGVS
ncbi:MAG: septum formation initiator family protein [Atopobiaceae bacterium]|nr:septum formation initiator family protein [Atopobiaceae bacterium]